jgi:outer membrane protein OmpA-like peptidoglycan-associated protein
LVNLKNDLTFDTGKSDLKPEAQIQLSQMGDIMAKYPEDRIQIQGFTDSAGGESFNQLLSQQRAHRHTARKEKRIASQFYEI